MILNAFSTNIAVKKLGNTVGTNMVLLQVISELHGQPIPVYQNLIDFLDEEFNETAPNIMIVDVPSIAFFESVSLRYNYTSFKKYNDNCFEYLIGQSAFLPSCIIQSNDLSFVNYIKLQGCFEDEEIVKDSIVNRFYLNCIIYLCNELEYDTFLVAVIHLLILLKSETKNPFVQEALLFFKTKFKNYSFKKYVESHKDFQEVFVMNSLFQAFFKPLTVSDNKRYAFFQELLENNVSGKCTFRAGKICDENTGYYSEKILNNVLQILSFFPTWTKIVKNK